MSQRVIIDIDDEMVEAITAVSSIGDLVQAPRIRYHRPGYGRDLGSFHLSDLLINLYGLIRLQLGLPKRPRKSILEDLVFKHPEAPQLQCFGYSLSEMTREELMAIIAAQHKGEL
jgi:hypothetical protein